MLMHNSGRYVRLCVRPTILILFKVYMYCFLNFFVFNFLKFLNKLCIYGANGLWSGATSIFDGIFFISRSVPTSLDILVVGALDNRTENKLDTDSNIP